MPAQNPQQEADNSFGPMWIIIGVFLLGGFIWYFFKTYIIAFILDVRLYEADFIGLFIPTDWTQSLNLAKQFIYTAKEANYAGITFTDLLNISNTIGDFLRYPVAIILMGLGVLLYLSNPLARFKKTHSMQSLLAAEKANWPQVMPVAHLNLVNVDIDEGPWAMALSPMQFAKKYKLLVIEKGKEKVSRFETKIPPTGAINRDDARRIFAMQLGRYWSSPEALPIHARALFAIFCARVHGDGAGAKALLDHISLSAASGKMNYSGTNELLHKYKDNKHIINLTKKHAFELTVMASMLEFARQDGVLASADFLWLKPVDRRLWFTLNCVGRQTPFAEVAGIYAHWIAEKEFGRRLNVPMVEEAVNGLEVAIKNIVLRPEDLEEQNAS